MKNITLSLDERLLEGARKYASKHNKSINQMVRELLTRTVKPRNEGWLEDLFRKADALAPHPEGVTWTREELHER